jgi:hypothetical protein
MTRSTASLLVVVMLPLAACAPVSRSAAVKLAEEGTVAAKATEAAIQDTRNALEPYIESQYLVAPLTGRAAPSPQMLASLGTVSQALALRAALMEQLARTYTAFGAHANRDAAADVEASVNELSSRLNAYAALITPGATAVPPGVRWVLAKAAGGIAAQKQGRELKATSAAIRERLVALAALLRREQQIHRAIDGELEAASRLSASALWRLGLGRPNEILRDQLAPAGLSYDARQLDPVLEALGRQPSLEPGAPGRTRADDLRDAVIAVLDRRLARRADMQAAVLERSVGSLEALVEAHVRFEADAELGLEGLAAQISALRAAADELRSLVAPPE